MLTVSTSTVFLGNLTIHNAISVRACLLVVLMILYSSYCVKLHNFTGAQSRVAASRGNINLIDLVERALLT